MDNNITISVEGSKRQRPDTPEATQSSGQNRIPPGIGLSLTKNILGIAAWVTEPDGAREQAERLQSAIRQLAILATNVCDASKSCDEGFSPDAVALLQEAGTRPLRHKKQPKTPKDAPIGSKKPKSTAPRQEKTSTSRYITRAQEDPPEDADIAPSPSSSSGVHIQLQVTPSQQGNRWRETWGSLSTRLAPATKTRVDAVPNRVFSFQGVHDALEMAEHVVRNHELLGLDAASHSLIKLSSVDSPARAAAVRCKTVWDQSLPRESLEHQAMSPKTPFGALFDADRRLERRRVKSEETASAFVLDHLVDIMFPEADEAERKTRRKRLTKDRDIARNIGGIVQIWGTGIIPLMCKAGWQSTFAQVAWKTLAPLFQQLKEQEPALFALTESVRENFYRFVEDRRLLSSLPEQPMRGMSMKKEERSQLTMLELVLPEARERPVLNIFRPRHPVDTFLQTPSVESMTGAEIDESDNSMSEDEEMDGMAEV